MDCLHRLVLGKRRGRQVRQQTIQDWLAGQRVSDVMRRDYTGVSPDSTLEQLVNEHIWTSLTHPRSSEHPLGRRTG